jgi:hypothetical protein
MPSELPFVALPLAVLPELPVDPAGSELLVVVFSVSIIV